MKDYRKTLLLSPNKVNKATSTCSTSSSGRSSEKKQKKTAYVTMVDGKPRKIYAH